MFLPSGGVIQDCWFSLKINCSYTCPFGPQYSLYPLICPLVSSGFHQDICAVGGSCCISSVVSFLGADGTAMKISEFTKFQLTDMFFQHFHNICLRYIENSHHILSKVLKQIQLEILKN